MSLDYISVFQLHANEDFATLKSLCDQFYSEASTQPFNDENIAFVMWARGVKGFLDTYPKRLSELEITIPPQEMKEIFQAYGVIALRRLKNRELTLYCGNGPLHSCAMDHDYEAREKRAHQHQGSDTVDFDLWMNPTVVMKWPPNDRSLSYFGKARYELVRGEDMSAVDFRWPLQSTLHIVRQILQPNGRCSGNTFTMILHKPGSDEAADKKLGRICEVATTCGLIAEVGPRKERIVTQNINARDNDVTFQLIAEPTVDRQMSSDAT